MDERCEKFWTQAKLLTEDGSSSYSPKLLKEISVLRRFLTRNQEQRFTDGSQNKLFESIGFYYKKAKFISTLDTIDQDVKESGITASLDVIKDALAMPFTVFGTKHKKTMLRWHDELASMLQTREVEEQKNIQKYQVLSVEDNGDLSLLSATTGEVVEDIRLDKKSPFRKQIKDALDDCIVNVIVSNSTIIDVELTDD